MYTGAATAAQLLLHPSDRRTMTTKRTKSGDISQFAMSFTAPQSFTWTTTTQTASVKKSAIANQGSGHWLYPFGNLSSGLKLNYCISIINPYIKPTYHCFLAFTSISRCINSSQGKLNYTNIWIPVTVLLPKHV